MDASQGCPAHEFGLSHIGQQMDADGNYSLPLYIGEGLKALFLRRCIVDQYVQFAQLRDRVVHPSPEQDRLIFRGLFAIGISTSSKRKIIPAKRILLLPGNIAR